MHRHDVLAPVLTPHGLLTLGHMEGGGSAGVGARARHPAGEGVCTGLRARAVVSGRRRSRDRSAAGAVVLARARRALRDRAVRASRHRRGRSKPPVPIPADGELDTMAAAVPPMTGAEYLTAAVLADLWRSMDAAFDAELAQAKLSVQEFLKRRHPAWNLVGRVHFNLAENRKDEDAPFAFLATYTTRLSAAAKAQHLPLGKALQEYAGAKNRERLLSLLMPVQRAAEHCPWLKAMVDAGEIFHPLRWSPQQALQFLQGRSRARKRRRRRADAGELAHEPPRPPAGEGNGRGQGTVAAGDGCAARLPNGGDARRRKALGGRDQAAAGAFRRAGLDPRQVGRGRSRAIEPDARAIRGHRAPRGHRWPVVRRGDAHAGRGRHCRGWSCRASRRRLEPDRGRSLAGGDARGLAPSRRARACRSRSIPCRARCGPISRRACNGFICSRSSGSGPASPTTWGSARPSRSCRCCWC